MKNKINIVIFVLLIISGINIIFTKKLPQGKYGAWIYIGDWGYLVGSIFILYGIYIAYNTLVD